MNAERKKILEMLANGKITADEADKLLSTLEGKEIENKQLDTIASKGLPKYLFVKVDSHNGDTVNIRVPLKLVRAGIKLKSLLPKEAQDHINAKFGEKGINLDDIKTENFQDIVEALTEFEVNVDEKHGDKVRIYCGDV
jgi:hypothetical protein